MLRWVSFKYEARDQFIREQKIFCYFGVGIARFQQELEQKDFSSLLELAIPYWP